MTTVFINGGTPANSADSYGGFLANTVEQILTEIRDKLLTVVPAWTATTDNIGTTGELEMSSGGDATNQIRVQFTKELDGNVAHASHRIKIRVRELDGSGGTTTRDYSPDSIHYLEVDEGNLNRLFGNVTEDSIALCTIPAVGIPCGVYAGYPERFQSSDKDVLFIGYIINGTTTLPLRLSTQLSVITNNLVQWCNYVYVQRNIEDTADWYGLYFDYHTAPIVAGASSIEFPYGLTGDTMGVWHNALTSISLESAASNHTSSVLGAINGLNNSPILERYGWVEGRGDRNYGSYTSPNGSPAQTPGDLNLRGLLKNVCRGLGAYPPGSQWEDSTGEVYMSCGDYGHQGIRIA